MVSIWLIYGWYMEWIYMVISCDIPKSINDHILSFSPHLALQNPLWICHAQRWIWGDIIWTMTSSRCDTRSFQHMIHRLWWFFSGDPKNAKTYQNISPNISDFSGDQEIWTIMILWSIQKCILKWIWPPAGHQTIVVSSFFSHPQVVHSSRQRKKRRSPWLKLLVCPRRRGPRGEERGGRLKNRPYLTWRFFHEWSYPKWYPKMDDL